jgi:hypothetical protein
VSRDSQTIPSAGPAERGFRATLEDAALWELVQLKCETRTRCTVCIRSGGRSGYLYFDRGQIVHASIGQRTGESAALEVLSWRGGSWQSCDAPWPPRPTITTPWQGLLLRATQLQDETAARVQPLIAVGDPEPEREAARPPPAETDRHEGSGLSYRPQDFEHAVRIDAQGAVTAGHGRTEEFAALVAYVSRLGDLIGELIGTGKLVGLDAALAQGERCLILRKPAGHTIALRPRPGVDLTQLRQQLEL